MLAACGHPTATPERIDVRVNHRVEAMAVAERLAGQPEAVEARPCSYVADVDAAFAGTVMPEVTRYHFEQAPRAALVDHAIDALLPKVDAFLERHRDYVQRVEAAFTRAIPADQLLGFLHTEFGSSIPRLHITPALLQGPQNYGLAVDGELYQLMGLGDVDGEGIPTHVDVDLIVHETSHGLVNDQIDARAAEIDPPATTIFALVRDKMEAQHYATPRIMVYEAVVRAIVVAWVRETRGDDAAAVALRDQVRLGFIWTADLEDVVGKRFDPASVAAFFTRLARRYANGLPPTPFQGPIDGVFTAPPFAITYAPALEGYVRSVAMQVFHDRVAWGEQPNMGLVAYGSPQTNPVVSRVMQRARAHLDGGGLVLGTRRWAGAHVALIMTWPREDDPSKGIVIYTAANDADIDQINAIHAGSTDYTVAEKTEGGWKVLDQANFPRARDGSWLPARN